MNKCNHKLQQHTRHLVSLRENKVFLHVFTEFWGLQHFFQHKMKKRFKNVSTYHKKMRGIFKFFGGCSAWSLQQRSAKTTAKTPQRRHKDGRSNIKGPRMLQRWTRPHWRYIVLIPPVGTKPSLQPFLQAKPHICGIFADLCKDLQRCRKDAFLGSLRIEVF